MSYSNIGKGLDSTQVNELISAQVPNPLTVAKGGTGVSAIDAAEAFGAIKQSATVNDSGVAFLAVRSEVIKGANTTQIVTPFNLNAILTSWGYWLRSTFQGTATGTGAALFQNGLSTVHQATTSGAGSTFSRTYGASQYDQLYHLWNVTSGQLDWSKPKLLTSRMLVTNPTDANLTIRATWGKLESDGVGNLSRAGFGIRIVGSATPYLELIVHNGSALTSVTSTYLVSANVAFDWCIISTGFNNVTLYVNGTSVASSTSFTQGSNTSNFFCYSEEFVSSGTPSSSTSRVVFSRGGFSSPL